MREYIKVNQDNIDKEHICCALSGKEANVKKVWMKQQYPYGYTFIKLNERAKVFVDFVPAEYAFSPIEAENMLFIYCLWVSGKYAKQGHASALLTLVEEEAMKLGKDGLVIVSSSKKKPFLSDYKFLMKKGFVIADEGYDDYILLYKPLHENAKVPKFCETVKQNKQSDSGLTLYYSNQCVFSEKYTKAVYEKAISNHWDMSIHKIENREEICKQGIISPLYSLFYQGKFITNEIMSVAKFEKLMEKLQE